MEVADVLHAQGDRFVEQNRSWLGFQQLSVLRAITRCRTAALGGHIDHCPRCGHQAISYNSCRNRHCPKCQAQARQRWLAAREQEVLGVPYFHVVFTIPHELNPLCQYNPEVLYNLLFRTSAATLLEVAADPKHLGAEIGFLSILHSWGQNLLLHPHVHCAIPAGGFSLDHTRWILPGIPSSCPSRCSAACFVASSLPHYGAPTAGKNSAFIVQSPHWDSLSASPLSYEPSFGKIGLSTPSLRSVVQRKCSGTSPGTRIGLPSATTDYWPSTENVSRFAGGIMPTATSNAK